MPCRVMLPRRSPFPDVKLGPFIGKGTFSRVFRATYQEAVCAVKVRAQMLSCLTSKASSTQQACQDLRSSSIALIATPLLSGKLVSTCECLELGLELTVS